MKCKSCNGDSFVKVPDFDKQLTVCLSCGEVLSIKFVDLSLLKKYEQVN
ncbi:hypothetical protein M3210_17440 [Oceanobacillus luteolus]|uniref:Uncharacterized protein n=1 Tax=Oceanobacillus luteolus TaxID=1274358 RepID=A0ABW4HN15_9BACI|nr:hypothetical protein [Oceanobacillus luteolus]MCM3742029.1 hypothetical protein [Oceanobacillus luteolus]